MDLQHLFDVSGKVAIVTGGSRGIGEMIAEGLVTNGVRTYITARKAEACDETAARLGDLGECISFPADLSTEEGISDFVERFHEREDRLHILVNNAGAAWGAPIGEFPDSGFDKVLAINVKAPFMLSQALLEPLHRATWAAALFRARFARAGEIARHAHPWASVRAPAPRGRAAGGGGPGAAQRHRGHLGSRLLPGHARRVPGDRPW